jgi:hypothetical protein
MTERRCYLVEKDGHCLQYRQFPGELIPPIQVQPDSERGIAITSTYSELLDHIFASLLAVT